MDSQAILMLLNDIRAADSIRRKEWDQGPWLVVLDLEYKILFQDELRCVYFGLRNRVVAWI